MDALTVLAGVEAIAYFALGLVAIVQAVRRPSRFSTYLALTVAFLALVLVLPATILAVPGTAAAAIAQLLGTVAFAASGLAAAMTRNTVVRYPRAAQRTMVAALAAATVLMLGVQSSPGSPSPPVLIRLFGPVCLMLIWAGCLLEPAIRLWSAAAGLNAIQRGRLRAVSAAFATLAAIAIATSVMFVSRPQHNPAGDEWFMGLTLLVAPILYTGLAPPKWLRRAWCEPEDVQFREAMGVMLDYSPDRRSLAERALEWPALLAGGGAAFVIEPDGGILATHGIDHETARRYARAVGNGRREATVLVDAAAGSRAMAAPLPSECGIGQLVVVSGPGAPYFGPDERTRLGHHARALATALERVRVTDMLRRREGELEAASRAKTDVMNAIAHDLRGPLAIILGYMDMLAEGAFGPVKHRQRQPLALVAAKGSEMQRLIDDLLMAARLENGSLPVSPEYADLRAVAADAVTRAQPRAALVQAAVTCSVPKAAVTVMADRNLVDRILDNLINNALAYGGTRPVVELAVEPGTVPSVTVTDNGVGIRAEWHDRIFERYFRTDEHSGHRGTGLGLYISRELAEAHGGDLALRSSAPGEGSTFVLSLPAVPTGTETKDADADAGTIAVAGVRQETVGTSPR